LGSSSGGWLGGTRGPSHSQELWTAALKENIVVRVAGALSRISQLPREPWVGEEYAYQFPAYYYALRAIHRRKTLKIGPREIIEEAIRD